MTNLSTFSDVGIKAFLFVYCKRRVTLKGLTQMVTTFHFSFPIVSLFIVVKG